MAKIGRYRHRLTLQEYSETQNTFGEPEKTWEDLNALWCSVEPVTGREYFNTGEIQAEVTVRVRMRYRPGLSPKYRFKGGERDDYSNIYYEIVYVQNFQYGLNRNETVAYCREITTDG